MCQTPFGWWTDTYTLTPTKTHSCFLSFHLMAPSPFGSRLSFGAACYMKVCDLLGCPRVWLPSLVTLRDISQHIVRFSEFEFVLCFSHKGMEVMCFGESVTEVSTYEIIGKGLTVSCWCWHSSVYQLLTSPSRVKQLCKFPGFLPFPPHSFTCSLLVLTWGL